MPKLSDKKPNSEVKNFEVLEDCRRCRAYGNVRAVLFGQKLFAESLYGVASIYMYIYGGIASAYPDNGVFDKKEEACTRKKR